MNPFSFYEHKALLVESVLVGSVAVAALRRVNPTRPVAARVAWCAVGWAAIGVLDWAIYAFGYTAREIGDAQQVVVWLRVPLALIAAFSLLHVATMGREIEQAAPRDR
jgi:hypothetical protein